MSLAFKHSSRWKISWLFVLSALIFHWRWVRVMCALLRAEAWRYFKAGESV